MREIKFRAWDTIKKEMHLPEYSAKDDFHILPDGTIVETHEHGYERHEITSIRTGWNIMQFTGLKDKNGKEIYEGDILKKTYGSSKPIFHVGYHEERAAFIAVDGYNELLFNHPVNLCEVIGNIYENPELLK